MLGRRGRWWGGQVGRRWRSDGLGVGARGRGIEEGGVFEDAAGVFGDGLYTSGIGRIGRFDAAIVGAGGFVNVAIEVIEQAPEEEAGIGGKHGVVNGIEMQFARRAETCGELGVVAFVLEVKLMGGAQGFARDLPGADGVVADHDALAAAAKNDVIALSALLPNSVSEIAVNGHVIVFHGTDAEEVIERERIELGDVENVAGELGSLVAS